MAEASVPIEGVDDAFPLTPAQLGMLYHSLAEPDTGVYVGILDAILPDDLDEDLFRRAWDSVANRHDALRSIIVWEGVDEPLQVVRSSCTIAWEDFDDPLPEENGKLSRDFVEGFRKDGIDLGAEPAMRFALGRLSSGARCFLWACHHALIDDWSQALALEEVQRVYQVLASGTSPVEEPRTSIGAFHDWLDNRDADADDAFWRQVFAGIPSPTRLQLHAPPAQNEVSARRGQLDHCFSRDTSDRLRQLAKEERCTLAALATGVWSVVLHKLTGADDIAFGLAATLRPPEVDGINSAIGNFVTTLPVRSQINEHSSLGNLVSHMHGFVQDANPKCNVALSRIQEIAGLSQDQTLLDSILSIKQDALAVLDNGDEQLFREPNIQFKSNFPLAVIVLPGNEIGLRVIFDPRRYSADAAEIVIKSFANALENALATMGSPPCELSLISQEHQSRAEAGLIGDALPAKADVVSQIRMVAQRDPSKIALQSSSKTTTYGALISAIDSFAARLSEAGIGRGDRVGLFLDRSIDVPVAMLGCLASGAAYVPFDTAFPDARLDRMIEASDLSAMVTTEDYRAQLLGKTSTLLLLDDLVATGAAKASPVDVEGEDTAYIMFTSGSTGEPKGVMVSHNNLSASTASRNLWYGSGPDRYLLVSSHAFDSSVAGIYWTLTTGGTLSVPNADEARSVSSLSDMLRDWKITHMLCLPSFYQLLMDTALTAVHGLQTVIVAGEASTPDLIAAHRNSGSTVRLVNEYGPTEATVWCSAADLTQIDQGDEVSIGGPIPGTTLRVLDAQMRPVPEGLSGELFVGGAGVAKGYFGRDQETDQAFVVAPDGMRLYRTGDIVRQSKNGTLTYIGRIDGQVKIRGYRVEVSEIESVLSARPDVREAAVTVFGSGQNAALVGFVQAKEGTSLSPDTLLENCRSALPSYMVPAKFVLLNHMPRTPNGKVDRKALPEPAKAPATTKFVEPATPTESVLAELWRVALWLDRKVGINENFHDLGGHSLTAIRLLSDIQETFDTRIPASSLGRITTVEEQAKLIEIARREGVHVERPQITAKTPDVLTGLTDGDDAKLAAAVANWKAPAAKEGFKTRVANENGTQTPLFFFFLDEYSFMQLADGLGPDQPVYGMRASNTIIPMSGEDEAELNLRRTALSYLSEVLELASVEPILIGGYCQGATIALNLAALLTAMQKQVATVISMEKTPPIQYPGHVDIMFAKESFLNPYLQFEQPEQAWYRRYGSHSFELFPGQYQKAFHPQNLVDVAASIRRKLAAARARTLPVLPRAARAVSWDNTSNIAPMQPGGSQVVEIGLSNTGTANWPATAESGLRLKACWIDENGTEVSGSRSYASFPAPLEADASVRLPLVLHAPDKLGFYRLEIDIIEEGVAAFSKMGNPKMEVAISVTTEAPETEAHAQTKDEAAADPLHDLAKALAQSTHDAASLGEGFALATSNVEANISASLGNLGQWHLRAGRIKEAERTLVSALELNPQDGKSLLSLARVRLSQKRYLSAQRLIWRAQKQAPETEQEAAALQALHLSPKSFARSVRDRLREAKATQKSKTDR